MWVAHTEQRERVLAADTDGSTNYYCPECGDEVSYTKSHAREVRDGVVSNVSAHFKHRDEGAGDGCSESDLHRKLKSIATSQLKKKFSGVIADAYTEDHPVKEAKTVESVSDGQDIRQPDAVLEFKRNRDQYEKFGKGLFIEIQVANKSKDKDATTEDYIRNEWSVLWLEPGDFREDELRIGEAGEHSNLRHQTHLRKVYPEVMKYHRTGKPPRLLDKGIHDESNPGNRYMTIHLEEGRSETLTWGSDKFIPLKLPPEAVAMLVKTGWDRLFDEFSEEPDIPDSVDCSAFEWVPDVSDYTVGPFDAVKIMQFVDRPSRLFYTLREAWKLGVLQGADSPKELLEDAGCMDSSDWSPVDPKGVYEEHEGQVQSSWHVADERPEIVIVCDDITFMTYSSFEEYYSERYRKISPIGVEILDATLMELY